MNNKLDMKTVSVAQGNIEKIRQLFPDAVTEVDKDGKTELAIDFDVLKQELSESLIDDGKERYQMTWPGKRQAVVLANTSTTDTLRPCKEESVDFDNTQNLYIEGDNLNVLKLLRETYLGKVKMIYIDPPYNTGNDSFVYNDCYSMDEDEFLKAGGYYDEDGNRVIDVKENKESNGRFHTDWLNMLYPRLRLARDLLTDDGAIFIHIDDNEIANLVKICDEIYGRDNYINIVTVKTKVGGVSGSSEGKSLKDATEYICIYAKDKNKLMLTPVYIKTQLFNRIKAYEATGKSWKYTSIITKLQDKVLLKEDKTKGIAYYGYNVLETMSISAFANAQKMSEAEVYNRFADRIFQTTNAQSSVRQTVIKETNGYDYPMYSCEYIPIKGKNEGNKIEVLYKGEQRRMMMFLSDAVEKIGDTYYYLDRISTLWDDIDYNNLTKEGEVEFANGKKPIKLLQRIINLICNKNDIVLDYFSGSASTAHAVIQQNLEDGGNRKFIMVQLPEKCDEKSEAYKAGYKNICKIGKERIRRAGAKIKDENGLTAQNLDTGFRVLKLDSSNMQDVYYNPAAVSQTLLDATIDNIKPDRIPLDLLFQVMLELGVPLSAKIEENAVNGNTYYAVNGNDIIACFDDDIDEEVITAIAKQQPLYAVFKDQSFASDSVAINNEQLFKTYSPATEIKVI